MRWSVGRATRGIVPAGAAGTLGKYGGLWIIRFDKYPVDDEWPCLVGFRPAKLPPWVVEAGKYTLDILTSETLSDVSPFQMIWNVLETP